MKLIKIKILKKCKCGNLFEVIRIKRNNKIHIRKSERKCCSIKCAHKRKQTLKTRRLISKKLKIKSSWFIYHEKLGLKKYDKRSYRKRRCLECKKKFKPKKRRQVCCSRKCARLHNIKCASKQLKKNPPNWSLIQKKAYNSGRNYIAGGTTKWYKFKKIKVQGSFELRTCIILEKLKNQNKIKKWEYASERIKYLDKNGIERTYIIDFKIYKNNNKIYYIEVKGYKKENDDLKWLAVKNSGKKIYIWYLKNIEYYEKKLNIKRGIRLVAGQ